jgi:hypothetical protein
MSLVRCRECGNAVSTEASSCPKCGAPVVAKQAEVGGGAPVPYVPFWTPSRIVGGALSALGTIALLFAVVQASSLESQFRRGLGHLDLTMLIAIAAGGYLLLVGIPLLAGLKPKRGSFIFTNIGLFLLFIIIASPGLREWFPIALATFSILFIAWLLRGNRKGG